MGRGHLPLGRCLLSFPITLTLNMAMRVALVHGMWVEVTGARVDLKHPESWRGPPGLLYPSTHQEKNNTQVAAGPSMNGHVEDM